MVSKIATIERRLEKLESIERRLQKLENEGSLEAMQKLVEDAKLEMNAVLVRNGMIAKQRIAEATERNEMVRKQLDDYVQKTSESSLDLLQRTTAAMAELQALDGRMTKDLEDLIGRAEALNASLENLPTAGKFQAVANDVTSLQKKVTKLEHAGAASPRAAAIQREVKHKHDTSDTGWLRGAHRNRMCFHGGFPVLAP